MKKMLFLCFTVLIIAEVAVAEEFIPTDAPENYTTRKSEYDDTIFYINHITPTGGRLPVCCANGAKLWGRYTYPDGHTANVSYTVTEPDPQNPTVAGSFLLTPEPLGGFSIQGIQGVR